MNPNVIPPHNHEAERGVLGSMLCDPADCIALVTRLLTPADFHYPAHRTIFEITVALWNQSQAVDIILLTDALRKAKQLDAIGGGVFLSELLRMPTAANAGLYAAQVREAAVLRQMWQTCAKVQSAALEPDADIAALAATLSMLMADVAAGRGTEAKSMDEHVREALERYEAAYENRGTRPAGVMPFGLRHLDEHLAGGSHPGDLVVIAAETSGGKTALAVQAASMAAVACDAQVLVASYEMSAPQLTDRLVALASTVPSSILRSGLLSERNMQNLNANRLGKLQKAGLHLRDQISRWTVDDIASEARAIKARHGLGMVVVDYLQLAEPRPAARGKQQNRERDVADMSKGLKALAMELRVPVVALSQLTDGKLRESRAIGHDADVVLVLGDDPEGAEDVRVCRIEKNRHGARDIPIYLSWDGPLMKFGDTNQPLKLVKPVKKAAA